MSVVFSDVFDGCTIDSAVELTVLIEVGYIAFGPSSNTIPSHTSHKSLRSQIKSFAQYERAIYSASLEGKALIFCFFVVHETGESSLFHLSLTDV